MKLVLGSASPRRREILGYFGMPFQVKPPEFDESSIPFEGDPAAFAERLAQCKGETLRSAGEAILTADTVVYANGKVYGKPTDADEGLRFLEELAGSWHSVFTGIALHTDSEAYSASEETRVLFNDATSEQLKRYQEGVHCVDKAGGYAIQQAGGLIVNRIDGCYYNVMGLPINAVERLLSNIGISLWQHLR